MAALSKKLYGSRSWLPKALEVAVEKPVEVAKSPPPPRAPPRLRCRCNECGKRYETQGLLKVHMKREHPSAEARAPQ